MKVKRGERDKLAGGTPKSEFSRSLRQANILIGEGKTEQALKLLSEAAGKAGSAAQKAKVAALVAKSQFALGRYGEASAQFFAANAFGKQALDDQDHWLPPALGAVRASLKSQDVETALRLANEALAEAEKRSASFNTAVSLTTQQLKAQGALRVGPRPIRYTVALTRIGGTFWEAGYVDEAKRFLQKAVEESPNGASRSRQILAAIHLQEGLAPEAEQYARESLQMGRFQAKTLASWPILIAARASQGKPFLEPSLFRSLQSIAKRSVFSRASLMIVSELRRRGDSGWKSLAESAERDVADKVVRFEISKMLLAEAKRLPTESAKAFRLASRLLGDPLATPAESVALAKCAVEFGILSGNLKNGHTKILKDAQKRFGDENAARVAHAMALGAMMAKSYDLARTLLTSQLRTLSKGSEQWSKSLWALAKMEAIVGNPKISATHYLSVAASRGVPGQFRLQAFLYGIGESQKAGDAIDLADTEKRVKQILADITDYRALLDAARQLSLAGSRFRKIFRTVALDAEAKAIKAFTEAVDPGRALVILNHLARRQYYDLTRLAALTDLWESLSDEKIAWLWSRDAKFWEYVALVISAYFDQDATNKAEEMAKTMLADVTVPEEGRVHLRTTYANWLLDQSRDKEAALLYEQVRDETPSHRLAAFAHYWLAIRAAKTNDSSNAKISAEAVRRCLAPKPGYHWEWTLDCKAALLLQQLYGGSTPVDMRLYRQEFIKRMNERLTEDLKG